MKIRYIVIAAICQLLVIIIYIKTNQLPIESRFFQYEKDFQSAADAYINGEKYNGETRWLALMPPGENAPYLGFHMGENFTEDYYAPRIVYIASDSTKGVSTCSFDGKLIKKLKAHWYICQEERF